MYVCFVLNAVWQQQDRATEGMHHSDGQCTRVMGGNISPHFTDSNIGVMFSAVCRGQKVFSSVQVGIINRRFTFFTYYV